MRPVHRSEILDLGAYELIRERFVSRIILEKKSRRLKISDELGAVFENHDTALLQIQEMLRTERITSEAGIRHEIDTYNELVPGEDELSATMFVEILDKEARERRLVELAGLERHIGLSIAGKLVRARPDARSVMPDRTTAVHYLKFPLGPEIANILREGKGAVEILWVIDHPKLDLRTKLPPNVVSAIAGDLA